MAFLRRRPRSVPSLPPPRFALGLAFVKSGSPRLYAPPSRSRTGAERQGFPRRPFLAANPSLSWPGEHGNQWQTTIRRLLRFSFSRTVLCRSPGVHFHALPSPSAQMAKLWRGVERRRVVTEVFVAPIHVRFKTPLAQVDRDDLPARPCRPVSLNRIDLVTPSQEF